MKTINLYRIYFKSRERWESIVRMFTIEEVEKVWRLEIEVSQAAPFKFFDGEE